MKLFLIEIAGRSLDRGFDLTDTRLDLSGISGSADDNGILFAYLDLSCFAEHVYSGILKLVAQLGGNDLASGEYCDILKHILASVAEAGSLDRNTGEGSAELIDDKRGQSLALYILGDNDELSAGLYDLLEQRQNLLNVGDLLIGYKQESVVYDGLHLIGIGNHIRSDISAVELHTLDYLAVGIGSLGFLDGDNAVGGYLLHCVGNKLADNLVAGRNGAYAGDVLGAADLL